jgi:hypothetical protein
MNLVVAEEIFKKIKNVRRSMEEGFDLSSFKMKQTLCPDVFDENKKMIPEVRKNLLKVGKDFYDYCNIEWVDLQDIILTGSLANYNWSQYSDVDLHIVVDYSEISKNDELTKDFAWSKKELWNQNHDIFVKKFPVELYMQDSEEELVAGGVYSVLYDKWIKMPVMQDVSFDENLIQRIIGFFEAKLRDLNKKYLSGDLDGLYDEINDIKKAIAELRKRGLQRGGEFSPENIAFKSLRRMGLLDKLDDMKSDVYDSQSSYEYEPPKPRPVAQPKMPEKEEDKSIKPGLGRYMILGKRYTSLRQAEKKLGIPKSTLQYRVKSDNPEFSQYKELESF